MLIHDDLEPPEHIHNGDAEKSVDYNDNLTMMPSNEDVTLACDTVENGDMCVILLS
jgi:hypothetical protein